MKYIKKSLVTIILFFILISFIVFAESARYVSDDAAVTDPPSYGSGGSSNSLSAFESWYEDQASTACDGGPCTEDYELKDTTEEKGKLQLVKPEGEEVLNGVEVIWIKGLTTLDPLMGITSSNYCSVEGTWKLRVDATEPTRRISAHTVNWDDDEDACDCIGESFTDGTDYNTGAPSGSINTPGGRCCGDDMHQDGGFTTTDGKYICVQDTSSQWKWKHVSANQAAGDIYTLNYGNYDVVSDGSKWYACSAGTSTGNYNGGNLKSSAEVVTANEYQYICYKFNETQGRFGECKGDTSSYNANLGAYGASYSTGNKINISSTIYYCSSDKKWYSDLDSAGKDTCETVGLAWTGTQCCGDDVGESYNDLGGTGACFNGKFIGNGNTADNERLVASNGQFYGCSYTVGSLVSDERNYNYCESTGGRVCLPDGSWSSSPAGESSASSRNTPKSIPEGESKIIKDSCCASSSCWNGDECIQDESQNTTIINPYIGAEDYRCVSGIWNIVRLQCTWDNSDCTHTCPTASQCMVDPNGNASYNNQPELFTGSGSKSNPQCIGSGQYIGDHYCDNSSWTSRTKSIAMKLLDLVNERGESDYVLFCDHYENALNDYDYSDIQDYLRGTELNVLTGYTCPGSLYECANNICVLKYKDSLENENKIVLGTTINTEINNEQYSFLKTLDFPRDHCEGLIGNHESFALCDQTDKTLWYADDIEGIIYSQQGVVLTELTAWESFIKAILSPIDTIKSLITTSGITIDYSYAGKIDDLNRIYFARGGSQSITGVIEKPYRSKNELIVMNFTGFSSDICSSVDNYAENHPAMFGHTYCNQTDSSYYILSDQDTVVDIWPDFSSKLRLH